MIRTGYETGSNHSLTASSLRRVVIALAVLLLLPVSGALYEWRAEVRDAARFPPAGVLVDVGKHRLQVICIGEGAPTVFFEASGFSNSTSSAAARTAIAARTRVCSYDRVGVGWSDSSPREMSIGALADDLAHLQDRAHLMPPFIIVASSIGGLPAEMFARRYPDRVAGLVLLDAMTSAMIPIATARYNMGAVKTLCTTAWAVGRIGLIRLLDPWDLRASDSDASRRSAALMYRAQPWNTLCALARAAPITQQEFDAAPALRRDVPLAVLSAEVAQGLLPRRLSGLIGRDDVRPELRAAHERLARQSSRGSWRIIPGSGHLIANDRPEVVVDAVFQMLSSR